MYESYLSREVLEGMRAAARADRVRRGRIRVRSGGTVHKVLRLWRTGFAIAPSATPPLRGLVDLYDGARHLSTCLIVASEDDGSEMVYEFKRNTAAVERSALDFARDGEVAAGLIPKFGS